MASCLICYRKEKGKTQPHLDCDFICSTCVQKLCRATPEQIKALYQKAVDQGLEQKADIFKTLILEEEEYYERETFKGKTKSSRKAHSNDRDMDRKRAMRALRPSHNTQGS